MPCTRPGDRSRGPVRHDGPVPRPEVIVLDVNETLTDQSALAARFQEVGAPAHLVPTWFAGTLRDGMAMTVAGGYAGFAEVAGAVLASLLGGLDGLQSDVEQAVSHVLHAITELPLHDDVGPGVRQLRQAGFRVIALTNGAAQSARTVLERGGVADELEHILSIDAVRRWKPAPETYRYAADTCGVAPGAMVLAAVHPWDIDGARRAGLAGAWIDRHGARYPPAMYPPSVTVANLISLADALAQL